jgi:transcriptional regulator with PAS, ATPase and Fis domain
MKTSKEALVIPQIPPEVLNKLLNYNWPGNLRELKNTLQRMVMLSQGRAVSLADLPPVFTQEVKPVQVDSPYRSLEEVEKNHILSLLSLENNLEKSAEILGITKATLWRKRKQYGLI